MHLGLLAEEFLETAASQLTMCGLCELSEHLQENQLAVLFRNNHFNTIYKKAVGLGSTNLLRLLTTLPIDLGF